MRPVHTVDEVRAAEEQLFSQVPDGALMGRASAGLARRCSQLLHRVYGTRVVILAGAGNNGGDALFAGALLAARGAQVDAVLLAPDRVHAAGLAALRRAGGRAWSTSDGAVGAKVAGAELVLDGIVGIGGRGALRPEAVALVDAINADAIRVAVDVPSGVSADTGTAAGEHVAADVTVTFGVLKPGLVIGAGRAAAGVVEVVDIGLGAVLPSAALGLVELSDVAGWLPVPTGVSDKYTRGVVGVASGSQEYGGAAVLSVGGAARGGAGMVRYTGDADALVRSAWPEVIVSTGGVGAAGRVQAWVVGPGLGTDVAAERTVRDALAADVPVLLDADALTVLSEHPEWVRGRAAPTVLTPHDREFARLAGEVGEDRVAAARRAAAALGVVMLLKGDATVIAEPGGYARICATGVPWLGTAGSGDVLSGLIGALLAGGVEPFDAAAAGAFVHGLAGSRAAAYGASSGPIVASDVVAALSSTLASVHDRHGPARTTSP